MRRELLAYYSGRGRAELIMIESGKIPEQIEQNLKEYFEGEFEFNLKLTKLTSKKGKSSWLKGMEDAFKDRNYSIAAKTVAESSANKTPAEIYR